jgi:hypothetical protein
MKNTIFISFVILIGFSSIAQQKATVFGGFESNAQWYLNDKNLKDEFNNPTVQPENPLRSNNYLFVNYKYLNWTAGIQAEAYQADALLNLNPKYVGTHVATYFIQFKNKKIDFTLGYFYEQFGSGLLFRSWEDRALGLNNALRGARFIYKPTTYLTVKSIFGQQRSGFDVANSKIYGLDTEMSLSDMLKFETTDLSIGLTYIGRDEKMDIENQNFNNLTNGFGGRINYNNQSFYLSTEYDYKSKDAVVQIENQIDNRFIKPGTALLVNTGYSKKGFGIDATFRRIENMSFFSERSAKGNKYNDRIMNFIPSLTKQHHYNLANIYAYQAQPNVYLVDKDIVKAGEIGGQIDVFYEVKKGTLLGGKNGLKIAGNVSSWNALSGTFYINTPQDYKTDYFGFGKRYFTDCNTEITKKWNSKWQTVFSYINQFYDKKLVEGEAGIIKSNIVAAEATYKFSAKKSIRVVGEHLWADYDKKNWVGGTTEFNMNSKLSFYVSDLYNYGNDNSYQQNHYYNLGGSFRKNATRIALNYGRQRGGLVCVGGICRQVPESSGISIALSTAF